MQGPNATYNLVSLFFLGMSVLVIAYAGMIAADVVSPPGPLAPETDVPTPTLFIPQALIPTNAPEATFTFTPQPTWTPSPTDTPAPSQTATQTLTPTITLSPTATLTLTSPPPTETWTPSPTLTLTPEPPTETWTPTSTPTLTETPVTIIYRKDPNTPNYLPAPGQYGCNWQGVTGQVTANGQPVTGVTVRVLDAEGNELGSALSGSAPDFGASGWLIQTGDAAVAMSYQVEVVSPQGNSPRETISFPGSCNSNLAIINFVRS